MGKYADSFSLSYEWSFESITVIWLRSHVTRQYRKNRFNIWSVNDKIPMRAVDSSIFALLNPVRSQQVMEMCNKVMHTWENCICFVIPATKNSSYHCSELTERHSATWDYLNKNKDDEQQRTRENRANWQKNV